MIEKFHLERLRYLIEYFILEKVILYHTTSNLLYSSSFIFNLINSLQTTILYTRYIYTSSIFKIFKRKAIFFIIVKNQKHVKKKINVKSSKNINFLKVIKTDISCKKYPNNIRLCTQSNLTNSKTTIFYQLLSSDQIICSTDKIQ